MNLKKVQNSSLKLKIKFDTLVKKGYSQAPEKTFKEFSDLVDNVKNIRKEVVEKFGNDHLKKLGAISLIQAAASEAWLVYYSESSAFADRAGAEAAKTFPLISNNNIGL